MSPAQPQRIPPIHPRFPIRLRTIFCHLFNFPHYRILTLIRPRIRTNPSKYPHQSVQVSVPIRPRIRTNPPTYPHQSAHISALICPRIRANPSTYPRQSVHVSALIFLRMRASPYSRPHLSVFVSAPVRLWPDTNLLSHTNDAFRPFLYTELFVIY